MSYKFYPGAATEYAEHVAFYKSLDQALGTRFHVAVKALLTTICETPLHYRIEISPNIRYARIQGFPYNQWFGQFSC